MRAVLAPLCLALSNPGVRRLTLHGSLAEGLYAKDVILSILRLLGVKGGVGYAYEYGGEVVDRMRMEARMSVCNMSIEGGARCGYVNPDQTTFDYLRGRPKVPSADGECERAVDWWKSRASGLDAEYDDVVDIDGSGIAPTVTWETGRAHV